MAVAVIAIVLKHPTVGAQAPQSADQSNTTHNKSATIALSIAMPQTDIPVGQTPWVLLTVKNLSGEEIAFPQDRVYVEGENGGPPTTLRQRQLMHRPRPGEPELAAGGFEPTIAPGNSFTRKYDLSKLYDLTKPGKYSVYIEVLDAFHSTGWKGGWMRSPTAHFEIQAPNP